MYVGDSGSVGLGHVYSIGQHSKRQCMQNYLQRSVSSPLPESQTVASEALMPRPSELNCNDLWQRVPSIRYKDLSAIDRQRAGAFLCSGHGGRRMGQ